jgi:hypothetical protein
VLEGLIAISIVAVLIGATLVLRLAAAAAALLLPIPVLAQIAGGIIALGLGVSIPAAIAYHVLLMRYLGPRGDLDAGWIWHPTRLHPRLHGRERTWTLAFFAIGAAGWTASVGGALLLALAFI